MFFIMKMNPELAFKDYEYTSFEFAIKLLRATF